MKIYRSLIMVVTWLALLHSNPLQSQVSIKHNLVFSQIPAKWDEAIPLGNGMLGVLVWQKDGKLRLAIDRADLWDLRPTAEIEKFTYQWAYQHRLSGDWDTVWKIADEPYDRDPAPTKIPGGAVEFDITKLGQVLTVELDLKTATCKIEWENGEQFRIFVDATKPVIRYTWQKNSRVAEIVAPAYHKDSEEKKLNPVVEGSDLSRLGYPPGKIKKKKNQIIYSQKCWGPLVYELSVATKNSEGTISLTSDYADMPKIRQAGKMVKNAIREPFSNAHLRHAEWWKSYWDRSFVSIPDKLLEKQWYLEMYKFGSASRKGAPPISLQAIWTADNGKLPPWKGDYHNDLNTQLSYWPGYSSNHPEESSVFTDWLWNHQSYFKEYTQRVFSTNGINVPGVATLRGREMGGWHMYAMSPTISCWLAQHFYLEWKYTMDRSFLQDRAWPWVRETAGHIEQLAKFKNGYRTLPMSSSPEFHDGYMEAWFLQMTNYDLALCKYVFKIAAEMAAEMGLMAEQTHLLKVGSEFPELDISKSDGLTVAPGYPYKESHRHFSHLMAFHPLGLLSLDNQDDKLIIESSLRNLEKQGTSQWTGYSFSWLGNLYARTKQGNKAVEALNTFARCFCSPNSFHLNGDQCKEGHSSFTYDPFTLEGNFAFAAGIQEMLLQSHLEKIEIMPAIPQDWKEVSFRDLRAQGAFLVSAEKKNGVIDSFAIYSEKGGEAVIQLPFPTFTIQESTKAERGFSLKGEKNILRIRFEKGGRVVVKNGYE